MRRVSLAVVVAFVLLFVCALVVFGQGGTLRLLQPAVATINQSVPVQVTLGGIVNGQQVTLTAPDLKARGISALILRCCS